MRKTVFVVALLLTSLFSMLGLFDIPSAHAARTIIDSFSPTPGTSTLNCQVIAVNFGNPSQNINYCIGLSARVWKDTDAMDPNHDYYGVWMEIGAINGTDGCFFPPCSPPTTASQDAEISSVYPLNGYTLQFPSFASDQGYNPQGGSYNSQTSVSFYAGTIATLCMNMFLPAQSVSCSPCPNLSSTTSYSWTITETFPTSGQTVFANYADFGAFVAVPKGKSFTAQLGAHVTVTTDCNILQQKCSNPLGYNDAPFNVSGSLYVDPSNIISVTLGALVESCSTEQYCVTLDNSTDNIVPVYVVMADSSPETWSLSSSCPSGWSCILQSSSVYVNSGRPVQDQLYLNIVNFAQTNGWYTISITGTNGAGS